MKYTQKDFRPGQKVIIKNLRDGCIIFKLDEQAVVLEPQYGVTNFSDWISVGKTISSRNHGKDYWNFVTTDVLPVNKPIIIIGGKQ